MHNGYEGGHAVAHRRVTSLPDSSLLHYKAITSKIHLYLSGVRPSNGSRTLVCIAYGILFSKDFDTMAIRTAFGSENDPVDSLCRIDRLFNNR